jgi:hypothetical protein
MAEPASSTTRTMAQTRAPFSSWVGVVLLFALFGVIVLAIIGPAPRGTTYEQDRRKKRADILQKNREEEAKSLSGYAWIDKNKGTARIPVERAMELTLAQLAQQKPAAAYPIASPPATSTAAQAPAAPPPAPAGSPHASAGPKPIAVEGPDSQNRGQPAAAANPPGARPGTQPGRGATPAPSPSAPAAKPAQSPQPTATIGTPGTPIPVPGKSPGQP